MRFIVIFFCLLFMCMSAFAQVSGKESMERYKKQKEMEAERCMVPYGYGGAYSNEERKAAYLREYPEMAESCLGDSQTNQEKSQSYRSSTLDTGQCLGDCASEQGICITQCKGDSLCINGCSSAYGRCMGRCK